MTRDAAVKDAAEDLLFLLGPTVAALALIPAGRRKQPQPAAQPAGAFPDFSRRSPVPGLWGILTAPLEWAQVS